MSEHTPHIFLVEDDADDRHIMEEAFRELGFDRQVRMFSTSALFLKEILSVTDKAALPALIVLDFNMPGINGGELLVRLKESDGLKDIPVVIYSTGMRPVLKEILLSSGALNCYEKGGSYREVYHLAQVLRQLVTDNTVAC